MKAGTNLEKILESGRFAVTAEAVQRLERNCPRNSNQGRANSKTSIVRCLGDIVKAQKL